MKFGVMIHHVKTVFLVKYEGPTYNRISEKNSQSYLCFLPFFSEFYYFCKKVFRNEIEDQLLLLLVSHCFPKHIYLHGRPSNNTKRNTTSANFAKVQSQKVESKQSAIISH